MSTLEYNAASSIVAKLESSPEDFMSPKKTKLKIGDENKQISMFGGFDPASAHAYLEEIKGHWETPDEADVPKLPTKKTKKQKKEPDKEKLFYPDVMFSCKPTCAEQMKTSSGTHYKIWASFSFGFIASAQVGSGYRIRLQVPCNEYSENAMHSIRKYLHQGAKWSIKNSTHMSIEVKGCNLLKALSDLFKACVNYSLTKNDFTADEDVSYDIKV